MDINVSVLFKSMPMDSMSVVFSSMNLLQLIHTFLAQDVTLVSLRTRLQALTVSITLYARLRLRYTVVQETCNLLNFLFRFVISTHLLSVCHSSEKT